MRRLAILAVMLAGCGGAAPTPQIVYVTPAPVTAPTPLIVYVTPEPADVTTEPDRLEYSGKGGDRLFDPVAIEPGLYRFEWVVTSPRDDICYLSVDIISVSDGEQVGGFVSDMAERGQEVTGSRSEDLPGGRVAFDVSASDCRSWSLAMSPMR